MSSKPSLDRRNLLKSIGAATGLGLAGCTGQSGTGGGTAGSPSTKKKKDIKLIWAGETQTDTDYQMVVGWSQLIRQQTNGRITMNVQTTGGDRQSLRAVSEGKMDMGATTTPSFWRAANAKKPFQKKRHVNLMFTMSVNPFPIGYSTTNHKDVNYLADLEDKRVVTGPPGNSGHFYWVSYCKANDISVKTQKFKRVPIDEGFRLVSDGRADAVVTGATNDRPGGAVRKWMERQKEAKLVGPKKGKRSIALGKYVGGGVVWNLDLTNFDHAWKNSALSDQETIKMIAGTSTNYTTLENMTNETTRKIMNIAIEKRQKLTDYHSLWEGFANKPEKFAMAMRLQDAKAAPYHPGAVEALKAHDLWNDKFPVAQRG